jgi:hypothetical protein
MSFGGGGGGGSITAHIHNSLTSEGGPLKITNGVNTTQFNIGSSTTNIPLEGLLG